MAKIIHTISKNNIYYTIVYILIDGSPRSRSDKKRSREVGARGAPQKTGSLFFVIIKNSPLYLLSVNYILIYHCIKFNLNLKFSFNHTHARTFKYRVI